MELIWNKQTYSLTAFVELILDSAGGGPIFIEESFGDQICESLAIRFEFWVSALIGSVGNSVLGERRVIGQISGAVNSVGRCDNVGVAIGWNAQHDLVRGETGSDPCLDGLGAGASLNLGARVIQRGVGTDTRGSGPLTLRNQLSDVSLVKRASHSR